MLRARVQLVGQKTTNSQLAHQPISNNTHCIEKKSSRTVSNKIESASSLRGILNSKFASKTSTNYFSSHISQSWSLKTVKTFCAEKMAVNDKIRNVAIIAHVDHGKTTLVDQLLKTAGALQITSGERVMDFNALEKERGITIQAKNTAFTWKGIKVNLVDTPGHGDFGGEVERILSMVNGAVLVVDATEGPMAQTKFVLSKALKAGLKPLVVLNKMDRKERIRTEEVEGDIFDLFVNLDAKDHQLDYPTLYASGRAGWAVTKKGDDAADMTALLDAIVQYVPPPSIKPIPYFNMLVASLEYDTYFGRILTGRILSGNIKIGDPLHSIDMTGKEVEKGKVFKILAKKGLDKVVIEEAFPGDIVGIAGFANTGITHTLCSPEITEAIPSTPIDPPVISISFLVNKSPMAGQEAKLGTFPMIKKRLMKETETNVSLRVTQSEDHPEVMEVFGRGELQLGVLIENMRREGYEFCISRPTTVFKTDESGQKLEPIEEVTIDCEDEYTNKITERLLARKAELVDVKKDGTKCRLIFLAPSRALIGFRSELINETRGTAVFNHLFHSYEPFKGKSEEYQKGALIANATGVCTVYALGPLEERGILYVSPGVKVYPGMVIGEHTRDNDLEVNPTKQKAVSNVRTTSKDEAIRLSPPKLLTLEESIALIKDDELLEVTPLATRLRKAELESSVRRRIARQGS